MRQFFSRPHPWIMQAVGGLVAVVIFVPIAVYVYINAVNNQSQAAVPTLAPPSAGQPGSNGSPGQTNSGGGQVNNGGGKTYTIKMQPGNGGFVFSPAKLTIHVGDTVNWVDADSTPHNIVGQGNAASIINRTAINTDSYKVTFTKAGAYHYVCQVHLPGMVGDIIVQAGSPSSNNGQSAGSATGVQHIVKMQPGNGGFVFSPANISIKVGDTIKWLDVDSTPHNIVGQGNAASIINRTAINTDSYTVMFTKAGVYSYVCQVHLPGMVGKVTVS